MALRLIEIVLQKENEQEVCEFLTQYNVLDHHQLHLSDERILVRILLDTTQCEMILDLLAKKYAPDKTNRIVILPVQATLPRIEEENKAEQSTIAERPPLPARANREELYEGIKDAARCSKAYLIMVVLSTIVAIVGLNYNSVAIIIGAMVIAPLIGPNMALALSTTLGDLTLLRRAFLTSLIGIAIAIVLSIIVGVLLPIDPMLSEVVSRTTVGIGDITVALASGCAGALAFTIGASETLIGVMVAVALLPPLATFGLLLGGGFVQPAKGALLLFLINLICINLAGIVTFLMQGIQPATWWEKALAKKATFWAIISWAVLLSILVGLILLLQQYQ